MGLSLWRRLPLAVVALAACGDPSAPTRPAGVVVLNQATTPAAAGSTRDVMVRVLSRDGFAIPGVAVEWAAGDGGGRVASTTSSTDSAGTTSVAWTLGPATGTQSLMATVAPLDPVAITVTVGPGPPSTLALSSSLPTSATVGITLPVRPAVLVQDAHGNPVPGAFVTFAPMTGGGSVSAPLATSDSQGVATTSWTLGTVAATNQLQAIVNHAGLRFTVLGVPDVPAAMLKDGGDGQRARPATAVPAAPQVIVQDQYGNAVPDAAVTFTVTAGAGTIAGADSITDSGGRARAGTWTLGALGENALSASVAGLAPVIFTAEASDEIFFNLMVDAVHLNQGNQTLAGALGGVSGRPALLRVVLRANEPNDLTPPVRVRLYQGLTLLREVTIAAPRTGVPTAPDLTRLTDTWNLLLTANDVVPGLRAEAVVDPDGTIPENTRTDNRYPRGDTTTSFDVLPLAPLRIVFFPIHTTANNTTGGITTANIETFLTGTRQWIPNSGIETTVRTTFSTNQDLSTGIGWSTLLSDLQAVRTAEGAVDQYYHGIIGAFTGIAYGGLAYRPSNSSSTARSALSYDRMPFSPGTIAHELGHNLGRLHAPCGNPGGPDPNFPHADATLGSPGYDILSDTLVHPEASRDYMSYCLPRWTSDYTYGAIVQWRRGDPYAQPAPPATTAGGTPGLLVWGRMDATDITLNPAFTVASAPHLPRDDGANTLRGTAADGSELFRFAFDGVAVADGADPTERHFAFVVPLDASRLDALARLELVTPRGTAIQLAAPAVEAVVTREDAPGAETRLRWNAERHPAALVRDRRTGDIVAILRHGDARITAPSLFEVLLSDGVRSRVATLR